MFESFSIIFLIAAFLSYVNYRWIKLPNTIGLMLLGFLTAMLIIFSKPYFPDFYAYFCGIIIHADFQSLLLDGMLSFLLFAGAMHVNIRDLAKERWPVLMFASLGVIISTALVGGLVYLTAPVVGLKLPFVHCLLFGALISPTDPIAVIAILKKAGVSKSLELKIEGESLFNDGIGVVVFSAILLLLGGNESQAEIGKEVGHLFVEEVIGGLLYGGLLGLAGFYLIRSVKENAQLSVILSLGVAMGGYAIASIFHFSGPLAMVVAGLIIGNKFHLSSHEGETRMLLNNIWQVLDEILNGILFLLIGLSAHLLNFEWSYFILAFFAVLLVLLSRFVSVILPISLLKQEEGGKLATATILTWGGLRGGISLALAMSLPEGASNEVLVFITYGVVLFSILVQGLSIGQLVKKLFPD